MMMMMMMTMMTMMMMMMMTTTTTTITATTTSSSSNNNNKNNDVSPHPHPLIVWSGFAIRFLMDMRGMLDWTCTPTTLDFYQVSFLPTRPLAIASG
eukprot:842734-Rhodomonas_salina.2